MTEIEDGQVTNILASLIICFLISIERELPEHARKGRAIRKVEEAVADLAKLSAIKLTEELDAVGVRIYNKLLIEFQTALEELPHDDSCRLLDHIPCESCTA